MDEMEAALELAAAYMSNNQVQIEEIADVLRASLVAVREAHEMDEADDEDGAGFNLGSTDKPAVSVEDSVHPDWVVCLEDGKKFKSLKRHLATHHGLTPEQYRARWGLSPEHPLVAPSYAEARSTAARVHNFGRGKK